MADHDLKTWSSNDPVASANATLRDDPLDPDQYERAGSEKNVDSPTATSPSSDTDHASTNAPSVNGEPSSAKAQKVSWSRWLNPLKRNRPPPLPNQRQVSREYTASFFSILTWQWIAPLMTVRRNFGNIAMEC